MGRLFDWTRDLITETTYVLLGLIRVHSASLAQFIGQLMELGHCE